MDHPGDVTISGAAALAAVTLVIGIVAVSLNGVIRSLLFRQDRKIDDEPQALAGTEDHGAGRAAPNR